jgi:signal transduction histidine kinase
MEIFNVLKRNPIVITLACAAAAGMVFISEGSYQDSAGSLRELVQIANARLAIQRLTRGFLDAETGQRGYLLTSRKEYLQPYNEALKDINESLKSLDIYYDQDPKYKAVLSKIHSESQAKLAEATATIQLHDKGEIEAAINLVSSGIGKEKMDAMRSLTAELLENESVKVNSGVAELLHTMLLNRIGVTTLSALILLGMYFYLRQAAILDRQRLEIVRLGQVERDRLEIEVAQRTVQLTELTQHLQTAREDERSRLARDLHDELGALLTSAKLDAARIKSRLGSSTPEAVERLNHLVEMLNSGIALKRRIIEDLWPSALSNLGLIETLEILAREYSERSGVAVHCTLAPVSLKATSELVIYRLVQESITNITKYAKADDVWVSLSTHESDVVVSVRDNGVGFDTTSPLHSAYGLVGMRYRVQAEGGTLSVVSSPGQGTLIKAKLPQATRQEVESKHLSHGAV